MTRPPDPKFQPIEIKLEALNDRCFAGIRTQGDGVVLWYYDPRNRILTPGIRTYSKISDFLIDLCGHLFDSQEPVETALLEAAKSAKISFLKHQFHQAIYLEDYEKASELRQKLRDLAVEVELPKRQ